MQLHKPQLTFLVLLPLEECLPPGAQLRKHVLVLATSFVVADHPLAVQNTLFGSLQNFEFDMTHHRKLSTSRPVTVTSYKNNAPY